ncbi:hypothetical protein [Actinobaculum suis]|uniref:hypothetical protein n=1 Tax=Actinobaculum suis TaxID=1657 RepID=UPI00163C1EEA|nr:hypothetical protein [Actinobaculum suis]
MVSVEQRSGRVALGTEGSAALAQTAAEDSRQTRSWHAGTWLEGTAPARRWWWA